MMQVARGSRATSISASSMSNAFAPLGVYLNFWQPKLQAGKTATISVMIINDEPQPAAGRLIISLQKSSGEEIAQKTTQFSIAGLGQQTYYIDYEVPEVAGPFLLKATATQVGKHREKPTVSRRRVEIINP